MKGLRQVHPYVAGEQPHFSDMIKINTNENPYPPSPKVAEALSSFSVDELKRYSSLDNQKLKTVLADKHQLPENSFLIGNGSDEILAFSFLAFFNSPEPLLFPAISYGFYQVWADFFNIPSKALPLTDTFEINLKDYNQVNGGIIIANPNAPTGIFRPLSEIEQLIKANPDSVVIIDEAYIDFGGDSADSLIQHYNNVVIIRTLSKGFSLAGLRVGYAIADPELIAVLDGVKSSWNPYSVDSLSETLAAAALADSDYYDAVHQKVGQTRDWFSTKLTALGFQVLPSKTNFVFAIHPTVSAKGLFQYLKDQHIFVRYFEQPRLENGLRISIGTAKEMEQAYQVINAFVSADKPH